MKRYLNRLLALSAVFLLIVGCRAESKEGAKSDSIVEVVGLWQLREVHNGVTYQADFLPDGRLEQHFEDHTGYGKTRFGSWTKDGDTLFIEERQGAYRFLISELSDSLLLLMREDSTVMLFDRVPPAKSDAR